MRDGDSFAKQFGGATGNDEDSLVLTIKKYLNGSLSTEKVDFYLADFRFSDNTQDYIVDEWTYVDLSSLGQADSLSFTLSSSDNGQFGMNTPAYFCIDEVITNKTTTAIQDVSNLALSFYPNPVKNLLIIDNMELTESTLYLYDFNGNLIQTQKLEETQTSVDVSNWSNGIYKAVIKLNNGELFFKNILKK